ncbi:MAG: hypothetical protein WCK96_08105 [Methylococcales bacterium]
MITDTEIKSKAIALLSEYLGDVETERFIALIQREPFDYTKWRQGLNENLSIEDISHKAMLLRNNGKNT